MSILNGDINKDPYHLFGASLCLFVILVLLVQLYRSYRFTRDIRKFLKEKGLWKLNEKNLVSIIYIEFLISYNF